MSVCVHASRSAVCAIGNLISLKKFYIPVWTEKKRRTTGLCVIWQLWQRERNCAWILFDIKNEVSNDRTSSSSSSSAVAAAAVVEHSWAQMKPKPKERKRKDRMRICVCVRLECYKLKRGKVRGGSLFFFFFSLFFLFFSPLLIGIEGVCQLLMAPPSDISNLVLVSVKFIYLFFF